MTYQDMRVCNFGASELLVNNGLDIKLLSDNAIFEHREAFEFILYIGDTDHIDDLKTIGYSDALIAVCVKASKDFDYICFYV